MGGRTQNRSENPVLIDSMVQEINRSSMGNNTDLCIIIAATTKKLLFFFLYFLAIFQFHNTDMPTCPFLGQFRP